MSQFLLVSPFAENGAILGMRRTREPEVRGTAAGHVRYRSPGPRPFPTPRRQQSPGPRPTARTAGLPAPFAFVA